jgi:hypothetical protein
MGLTQSEAKIIGEFQKQGEGIEEEKLDHQELALALFISRELGRPLRFICERLVQANKDMIVSNR